MNKIMMSALGLWPLAVGGFVYNKSEVNNGREGVFPFNVVESVTLESGDFTPPTRGRFIEANRIRPLTDGQNMALYADKASQKTAMIINRDNGEVFFSEGLRAEKVADTSGETLIEGRKWLGDIAGLQGPQGPRGPEGVQGQRGQTGPQGRQGPQGEVGPQGEQGPQGRQGPQGQTGPQGRQGQRGQTGPTGPQGPEGPEGQRGPTGQNGRNGRPCLDDNGCIDSIIDKIKDDDHFTQIVRYGNLMAEMTDTEGRAREACRTTILVNRAKVRSWSLSFGSKRIEEKEDCYRCDPLTRFPSVLECDRSPVSPVPL